MDIIEQTRQLGKAIQQDERYTAYCTAKKNNDDDKELQELIGNFNMKRMDLNNEMSKEDKDTERLKELDNDIKDLYAGIMKNKSMTAFNEAKTAMDSLMSQINNIITASANGEDPETCAAQSSCSGSCSSCSGCH
ncbi:MAG: YlbF family regulator [Oscillospiraceae bacterium]|nr:YlbF family regulator [Oscillospiraceae bacterium]